MTTVESQKSVATQKGFAEILNGEEGSWDDLIKQGLVTEEAKKKFDSGNDNKANADEVKKLFGETLSGDKKAVEGNIKNHFGKDSIEKFNGEIMDPIANKLSGDSDQNVTNDEKKALVDKLGLPHAAPPQGPGAEIKK